MKTALLSALLSALLLLTLVLTGGVLVLVHDAHQDLAAVRIVLVQAAATESELDKTIAKINAAADTLNAAAPEERKNWAATSDEAAKTGKALRLLISRTDRVLVDGTLLHFNAVTLPAIDSQIASNGDGLKVAIAKLGETADGMTAATGSLNVRLGDPHIDELLGHLNLVSAQMAEASGHANKILGDGEKVADHYEAEIMKPVSLARRVGEYVLSFGADARVLFTGGK